MRSLSSLRDAISRVKFKDACGWIQPREESTFWLPYFLHHSFLCLLKVLWNMQGRVDADDKAVQCQGECQYCMCLGIRDGEYDCLATSDIKQECCAE